MEDSDEERLDSGTTSKTKKANRKEEREDKVSDTLNQLREKHGNSFTPMQCRIWSEMVVGEVHSRLDDPPNTSMFMRAGGASVTKTDPNNMAQALTQAASQMSTAIATVLSPPPATQHASGCAHGRGSSPVIESQSECYQQLSELNNLKLNGIISDEEYCSEKDAIMEILSTLKASGRV